MLSYEKTVYSSFLFITQLGTLSPIYPDISLTHFCRITKITHFLLVNTVQANKNTKETKNAVCY